VAECLDYPSKVRIIGCCVFFVTKFSIQLSHRISMTSYLFSLLAVTTHAFHLMSLFKPSSSLKVTHRSFRHASPHRWNQLTHHSEFLIRIIHLPLSDRFEYAGLTIATHCYHLSSLFHCFTLSSKPIHFQKILFSTLVCFCLSD